MLHVKCCVIIYKNKNAKFYSEADTDPLTKYVDISSSPSRYCCDLGNNGHRRSLCYHRTQLSNKHLPKTDHEHADTKVFKNGN